MKTLYWEVTNIITKHFIYYILFDFFQNPDIKYSKLIFP